MADDINLPNLVSHLQVHLDAVSGELADATRQGSAMGSALGTGIHRELDNLLRHLPQVQIDGDSDPLDRDLARVHRQLAQLDSQRIGVDISVPDALRQLDDLETHLRRISDEHHDVNIQAATRGAVRQLEELRLAARQADDTDVDIDVDVHEDRLNRMHGLLGKIGGMAGPIGGLAGSFARVSATLGTALPAAAGLVSTLAQMTPAAGVAATGVLSVGLAVGTVKLATKGVSDALAAAFDPSKPKEFNDALKGLAPNAREFAKSVRDAAPALKRMQQAVQNKFFQGLGDQLERTGKSVLPVLRTNLESSAGALNHMAQGGLMAAGYLASSGTLGKALGSASQGLHNLSGIPAVVVNSLGQIGAAAGPSFEKLTAAAGRGAAGIGDKLSAAFESGGMQRAIEHAIDLIKQLAAVGANVGKVIGNIFSAVPAGGGGTLGILEDISSALANITSTKGVQQGLAALFQTMSTLGGAAAPLLAQALATIAPVFSALGPPVQQLILALQRGLTPIISALGPVLILAAGAVGQLMSAVAPLLPVIGQLAAALLPALQPILAAVGQVFAQLAPVVQQLASVLMAALAPILAQLPGIIGPLVQLIADRLIFAIQLLGQVLTACAPALVSLGQSLGQVLVAVAPLLSAIAQLSSQLLSALMPVIAPIISLIGKLASILATGLAAVLSGVVVPVLKIVAQLLTGNFSGAWETAKAAVSRVGQFIGQVAARLGPMIAQGVATAINWLKGMPGRAMSAISGLNGALVGAATRAGAAMASSISSKISSAVSFVKSLPGRAQSALGGLGGVLVGAGRSLIQGFINGLSSMFGAVKSKLGSLTNSLTDWKGPPKKDATLLTPAGKLLIQGLIKGITATTASLRATLQKTTKDLATWAADGLLKGVSGTTKQMQSALAKLASLVQKSYITNMSTVIAKDQAKLASLAKQREALVKRLGKASTGKQKSKLRAEIADIDRQRAAVTKEMATARAVQKSGTALLKVIGQNTARLNALAKQRDAVATKLAAAQKKLDDLTKARAKVASDITSGILDEANITKGFGDVNSVSAITVGLQQALKKTQEFQANIAKLKKEGLRGDLLQQIADAGVSGGAATAAALAKATPEELKKINDLQAQLAKSATATGTTVGDALYSAGINAAKGLVDGLKSQQKAIEREMRYIAENMSEDRQNRASDAQPVPGVPRDRRHGR
ncbi:hypothetical protein ACRJ4W_07275 [Streptomyces sp. GLT-R25]